MIEEMTEEEIRNKYQIPPSYGGFRLKDGSWTFSFCDDDITVHLDGKAFRSWMGFSSATRSHQFYKEPWKP